MNTSKIKAYYGKKAVVDNNVLSDFVELTEFLKFDCLSILNNVFSEIVVPKIILDNEVILPMDKLEGLQYKQGVIRNRVGYETLAELLDPYNDIGSRSLSEYDIHVIAIARELGYICISNDKPVRKACKIYNIQYTGIIGIISSAYENSKISYSELTKCFRFLFSDKSSCYLSSSLKKEVFDEYDINDLGD